MLVAATQVAAPAPNTAAATDTAFRTCEAWLLEPATWATDMGAFVNAAGLPTTVAAVAQVPDAALPPPDLRRGMHHFRVGVGDGGMLVTTSDMLPVCHIAGGGPFDLQPGVVETLRSADFRARWREQRTRRTGEMVSTTFVHRADAGLTMIVSHSADAGGRDDRVQLVATVQYTTES